MNVTYLSDDPLAKGLSYPVGGFTHPIAGYFPSIANYWVWLKNGKDEIYRTKEAVTLWEQHLDGCIIKNFLFYIAEANWYKITGNPELSKLLVNSFVNIEMFTINKALEKQPNPHEAMFVRIMKEIKRELAITQAVRGYVPDITVLKCFLADGVTWEDRHFYLTTPIVK